MLMFIPTAQKRGFTIVELLIVIVVIAILAAITIVAYNGVQQRAHDTKRKNDMATLAKLMNIYSIKKSPMYTGSGCGSGGNGSGYLNYNYPGYTSVMDCIKAGTNTAVTLQDNVPNCSGLSCRTYMVYTCKQSGILVTYFYTNLETGTHNGDELDTTCATSYDSSYGMNYFVKVTYE